MKRARMARVLAFLLVALPAMALPRAEIQGVLQDDGGAAVPGANVEIIVDGQVVETVTTSSDGSFSVLTELRPEGTLELRVVVPGFATQTVRLEPRPQNFKTSLGALRLAVRIRPPLSAMPPPPSPTPPASPTPENHAIVKVFYATDRQRVSWDPLGYGANRRETAGLHMGRFDVSVPRDHRMANVERPNVWTFWREDPNKHFIILRRQEHTYTGFYDDVSDVVSRSARKEAFVFIHGYNVPFEAAVYRTAQIAYDLAFDGAPILYSWPSEGRLASYPVDLNNSDWTVPHLQWFLEDVAVKSKAQVIHLIAHSMGNRALVNAVYRIATEQRRTPMPRFNQVILTAPDIDASTFVQLAQAVKNAAQRVTLYASSNDEALKASRAFQGYQRAGDSSPDVVVVAGIDTVDVSTVDTSFLGHSYYGDSTSVLKDIFALIRDGNEPSVRFGMRPAGQAPRLYWAFRP